MTTFIARVRGRLTYANVTASLALFVALGGTGYAAITLPRDSVGAKQIRANAVGSSEIRRNAIQTRDISRRAKSALRGQRGPAGPAGPAGPPGITEFVQVNSDARIVAGTTQGIAWSASDPSLYRIEFRRDVAACAYSAVLASVPGGSVPNPVAGRITVGSAGGPAVNVRTYDAAGAPSQQPFHLIVAC
jgi:hypothetical protein